jgi:predicted nucleic acid-binding protein
VIVLDTTVLVYAVGDRHELREPARALVDAVASGAVRATTTLEAIQEFAHVRARRRNRKDAATLASLYADLLSPLLEIGEAELRTGLRLFERHEALDPFDAVLAASAMALEATALVSADRAFGAVKGLRFVELTELDLAELE